MAIFETIKKKKLGDYTVIIRAVEGYDGVDEPEFIVKKGVKIWFGLKDRYYPRLIKIYNKLKTEKDLIKFERSL